MAAEDKVKGFGSKAFADEVEKWHQRNGYTDTTPTGDDLDEFGYPKISVSAEEVEQWLRLRGYMGKLPPARAWYSEEEELVIEKRLAAAEARRWTTKWVRPEGGGPNQRRSNRQPLRKHVFVPVLEAASLCHKEQGEEGLKAFWHALTVACLNGEFDGPERLHVVTNQPVIRMRFRSEHMRLLTADMYSDDDRVFRRLARCWLSRRSAIGWCERSNFPVPERWRLTASGEGTPRGSIEGSADRIVRRTSPAVAEIREVYRDYVSTWPADRPHPSEVADLDYLAKHFGRSVSREIFRPIRSEIAPDHWLKPGRPRGSKSAA